MQCGADNRQQHTEPDSNIDVDYIMPRVCFIKMIKIACTPIQLKLHYDGILCTLFIYLYIDILQLHFKIFYFY